MKKITLLLLFFYVYSNTVHTQNINWTDISNQYEFPEGLKLFEGSMEGNGNFSAWYYEVDMSYEDIAIRPYLSSNLQQVDDFTSQVGAYGAVNGGFFAGTSSVSSIIYPNEVAARNLTALTRNGMSYPVIRSIFALNADRTLSAEWVYHHSYNFDDIYTYEEPLPYECDDSSPLPAPEKEQGTQYSDIAYGIGGGPMLIKDGEVMITYCEEIFWGSGVFLTDFRPRTAVGYTNDQKVILFTTNSMKIGDMADELLALGCHEAMNLDGGGSTAIAAGETSIYDQNRAVPSILAVVHTDSLQIPQEPTYEKIIDTSDEGVNSAGSWFETANDGYWETPSMLHALGDDQQFYEFPLNLPQAGEYEIYGWWTASFNRSTDTPFIINHAGGSTTEAVDQTTGNSQWILIGSYQFDATQEEKVTITAAATTNQYVVADAIKVVSYDNISQTDQITTIADVDDIEVSLGTTQTDALSQLAQQTEITTSLDNTFTVELTWSSTDYQPDQPGTYNATGTFDLPEGVVQSDPPIDLIVNAQITVSESTSMNYLVLKNINIFPNPANDHIYLSGIRGENVDVRIFTYDGKLMQTFSIQGADSKQIPMTNFAPGVYFIHIAHKENVRTEKLILK